MHAFSYLIITIVIDILIFQEKTVIYTAVVFLCSSKDSKSEAQTINFILHRKRKSDYLTVCVKKHLLEKYTLFAFTFAFVHSIVISQEKHERRNMCLWFAHTKCET